jgi:2-iminobutanoate/2-iminopropanoate deaminase
MELWQRFTHRARRSILLAHDEATAARRRQIGVEHLLAGLARMGEGVAIEALGWLGVDLGALYEDLHRRSGRGPEERAPGEELGFTPEAQRVLQRAYELSRERDDRHIGTEHLLLALVEEPQGSASDRLRRYGVTFERVVEAIETVQQEHGSRGAPPRTESGRREPSVQALQETLQEARAALAGIGRRLLEATELLAEVERLPEASDAREPETGSENMTRQVLSSERIPPAVGPYSQAVRAGELLFCSGIVGLSPATGKLVEGEFEAEVRQVLDNLRTLLADCDSGLEHVVKTTVFLTDLAQFAELNGIYAEYFPQDPPARSAVQVAALPLGARIEVEAIALVP